MQEHICTAIMYNAADGSGVILLEASPGAHPSWREYLLGWGAPRRPGLWVVSLWWTTEGERYCLVDCRRPSVGELGQIQAGTFDLSLVDLSST